MTLRAKTNLSLLTVALLLAVTGNVQAQPVGSEVVKAAESVGKAIEETARATGQAIRATEQTTRGTEQAIRATEEATRAAEEAAGAAARMRNGTVTAETGRVLNTELGTGTTGQTSNIDKALDNAFISAQRREAHNVSSEAVMSEEEMIAYAEQQDLFLQKIFVPLPNLYAKHFPFPDLYAKYYLGKGVWFNPMQQSILRAQETGRTELLPYLTDSKKLKSLQKDYRNANEDGVTYDIIVAYVQQTTALMLTGKYWGHIPLNVPQIPAKYHTQFYHEMVEDAVKNALEEALSYPESTMADPNTERFTPTKKRKIAKLQEQMYEYIALDHNLAIKFTVGETEIAPLRQAYARAVQEGKTNFIPFLKDPKLLKELEKAYKDDDPTTLFVENEKLLEKIGIHPDRVADFELALNDLWLDICDYVEDTMWQMFLKGKSWDKTSLQDFVFDSDYYGLEFREARSNYWEKIK